MLTPPYTIYNLFEWERFLCDFMYVIMGDIPNKTNF